MRFDHDTQCQVLLLYPKTGMDFGSTVAPPHALLTIAAPVVKAGYKVKLLDQRTQTITEEVLRRYLSKDTICVALTSMTGTQIHHALILSQVVRYLTDGKVPIVWGGCHPTVMPQQTVSSDKVDIVVIGEGDETFLELVQALESKKDLSLIKGIAYKDGSKVIQTEERPLVDVESLLPVPFWKNLNKESSIRGSRLPPRSQDWI